MPITRLDLRYDGSGFKGYAKQEGHRTVQGELESALVTLLGAVPDTVVAGRTDAGVHAHGQVVSFSWEEPVVNSTLMRSLNGLLGPELAITGVVTAPDDFHARHSARWRRYRYLIDIGPAREPLMRHIAWHPGKTIDLGLMEPVLPTFLGEHDFSAFCRSVEGRENVRRVDELEMRAESEMVELWIKANAFCHQMVRSMVGYLFDVGRGFADPVLAADVLAGRDRSAVTTVAPPHGLTLWEVGYED